jgi:hypothetical protein
MERITVFKIQVFWEVKWRRLVNGHASEEHTGCTSSLRGLTDREGGATSSF